MLISLRSYTVMITITVVAMKMMTMMVTSSHKTNDENGEIEIMIASNITVKQAQLVTLYETI